MPEQFTRKNHIIATRFPIISAIIWIVLGSYIPSTIAATIAEPLYDYNPDLSRMLFFSLAVVISIISLLIFDKWFSPEYESSLKVKGLAYSFALTIPIIIFVISYRVFKIAMGYETFYGIDLETILMGARPGFGEEVFFRGIVVALLLRHFKSEKNIWFPAVFTGLFFGAIHLTNITSLEEISIMCISIVFATVYGIIFGIIFTLSGNIWSCIFLHTLYDTLAFSASLTDDAPNEVVYFEVCTYVVIMIIYMFVMVKNMKKASGLWNIKWEQSNSIRSCYCSVTDQ